MTLPVTIVGGGIAGLAAATVLSERGVPVELVESCSYLGGRAGGWIDHRADGEAFEMERGFHAFFRQYYTLRRLLRRVDPRLSKLKRLEDYPILGPGGARQSFQGLPRRTPWNVIALTARSGAMGLRDLLRVDKGRALQMLRFDAAGTYSRWDDVSARTYLDSLRFPQQARRMLFDVFAHSFFNPEEEMSAGELLMMFHFYFTGNPEGLVFDVATEPFGRAFWQPLGRYIQRHGGRVTLEEAARRIERRDGSWRVHTDDRVIEAKSVILALPVRPLQRLVADSTDLDHDGWRASIRALDVTRPFVVWRLWLDRETAPRRSAFVGTTGLGPLDNISLYHLFEDESRQWALRTGGSVVELHAYAVDPGVEDAALKQQMLAALMELYPELRGARTVEERYRKDQDCPAFATGSYRSRPEVATPFEGLKLAGDLVKLSWPSALMERAAASGVLAANQLLAQARLREEPIETITPRGMLAGVS